MLKRAMKVATVMATSVIAIPYALAILANLLYGWPRCENKYARALHPKKVFLLNCAILDELCKIKYLKLILRSRYFHSTAPRARLIKVCLKMHCNMTLFVAVPFKWAKCTVAHFVDLIYAS